MYTWPKKVNFKDLRRAFNKYWPLSLFFLRYGADGASGEHSANRIIADKGVGQPRAFVFKLFWMYTAQSENHSKGWKFRVCSNFCAFCSIFFFVERLPPSNCAYSDMFSYKKTVLLPSGVFFFFPQGWEFQRTTNGEKSQRKRQLRVCKRRHILSQTAFVLHEIAVFWKRKIRGVIALTKRLYCIQHVARFPVHFYTESFLQTQLFFAAIWFRDVVNGGCPAQRPQTSIFLIPPFLTAVYPSTNPAFFHVPTTVRTSV